MMKLNVGKFETMTMKVVSKVLLLGVVLFLLPMSAYALEGTQVVSGGGEIEFAGATETNWVKNALGGYDFLIVYTNTVAAAGEEAFFKFPGTTKARILAIGGGGGGGGAYYDGCFGNYGGGAGGGAGGMLETNDLFGAATYTVHVGKGGDPGKSVTTHTSATKVGKDGDDTVITADEGAFMTAYGGGGGGAESDGNVGGSGGGGSMYSSNGSSKTPKNGGAVRPEATGQGNIGGAGDKGLYGGGGGGAGEPGEAASTAGGGKGGNGKASSIAVDDGTPEANWPWYAGGGGGGFTDYNKTSGSAIAGGNGGGGRGGYGASGIKPTAGTDGTGGGGGGCDADCTGGKGGSGIVIVRVAAAIKGGMDKPADLEVRYDGKPKTSVESTVFYTVVWGTNTATEVGTYFAKVKLADGISWTDGSRDDVMVRMTIAPQDSKDGVEYINDAPIEYYGADDVSWIDNGDGTKDLLLKFLGSGRYTLPGTTKARILAVGGGGGGGGAYYDGCFGNYGGGAGGGAGGMLQTNDLFAASTNYVRVGKGGEAGKSVTTHTSATKQGKNGEDTFIGSGGLTWLTAYGGGGGGAESDGNAGGSGGGGSMYSSNGSSKTPKNGGAVRLEAAGQGNVGGAGDKGLYGGGGGGAGGEGAAASAAGGGVGGKGKPCDITLPKNTPEENWPWYAGGGAGGFTDYNVTTGGAAIPGGKGGGGSGGYGATGIKPKPGDPGTGGGGGGCDADCTGGRGGSGVVYVRISAAMVGPLVKPSTEPIVVTYDANAHTSVVANGFYKVTGQNIGTNAGTYVAKAALHDPNMNWPGTDSKDPVTVTLKIEKCPVTFSGLAQEGWTFGNENKPDPTFTVDPAWVKPTVEYALTSKVDDPAAWSSDKPTHAGAYTVRVRVPDETNFTGDPLTATFDVAKCPVTFTELKLRDWMFGTPEEETPNPSCVVDPPWVTPVYTYATQAVDSVEWIWSDAKPTTLGTHKLRVAPPDFDDYVYTAESEQETTFKIIKGLGNVFTDYIDITINGYEGTDPATLVNYPLKLELSETDPVGFLYNRVGLGGEEMAFMDAEGNVMYPYQVQSWDTNGVSVVYVKLPLIDKNPQTIRLYWHVRYGAAAPAHDPDSVWSDWTQEDYEKVKNPPTPSFDSPVYKDGYLVNYWVKTPVLSSTLWDVNDAEEKFGKITQKAEARFDNNKVKMVITNLVSGATYAEMPTRESGTYRVSFTLDDPDHVYETLETHVDFAILGHNAWDDLKGTAGNLTLNGRVMIANNDTVAGHEVTDQAYWQTREVDIGGGKVMTNDIYWTHEGEHGVTVKLPNLLPGRSHHLNYIGADGSTNVIWRFNDIMIGNIYNGSDRLLSNMAGLPWSQTALGISSYAQRGVQGVTAEVGNLVMYNSLKAAIYSPCYTNGIGTIYFDVVNGFVPPDASQAPFRIVVEVATRTSELDAFDEPLPPTDENAVDTEGEGIEGELGKIHDEQWVKYDMMPLLRDNGATVFTPQAVTNDLSLNINKYQTSNNFYRVYVNVNYRGPVRFRIRRVSCEVNRYDDTDCLILVDNIIVSYPNNKADLEPYGKFDETKTRKQILGQAGAMMTPFPAVTDEEVYGRGKATTYVNGSTNVNPNSFVSLTRLHYRWHYLDQASNDWHQVDLPPGDNFVAATPLMLPNREGDIEWWYESFLNIPYYEYFDYSGTGAKLAGADGKPLYSQETTSVTNKNDKWFLRLRPGKSELETIRFYVKTVDDAGVETIEPHDMELIRDQVWRGCFQTLQPVENGVQVRFEEVNRQMPGLDFYDTNRAYYKLHGDVTALPGTMTLERVNSSNEWSTVKVDALTGYLAFQIEEKTHGVSVIHADYQNFNKWSDANILPAHPFVGTSTDTNSPGMSGTAPTTREFPATMDWWRLSTTTNSLWSEPFAVKSAEMLPGKNWEVFKPFETIPTHSPNGFVVGPGQWVTGYYREPTDANGMALQMEGKGKGYIQFVNSADAPRGIESIKFNARLGQFIEFDDFSYYDGESKAKMTDYTFVSRAAFDINQRRDFSGDASLSLVAFYRPGLGCYEFRVEQYNGTATGAGSTKLLSLWRWRYDEESGEVLSMKIGEHPLTNDSVLKTMNDNGNYNLLFISVYNNATKNQTELCAGISTDGGQARGNTSSATCCWLSFYDTDADLRLKNGTYGVLSANCPGRFVSLLQGTKSTTMPTTAAKFTVTASKSFAFPVTSGRVWCQKNIAADEWALNPKRVTTLDMDDPENCALVAKAAKQPLIVSIAKPGTTDWKPLATNVVSNFGALGTPIEMKLYSLEECSIQIAPGGNDKTVRNDVIISGLEIRQWRGESYNDKEGMKYFPDVSYGSPTNFVFTQAWIKENAEGTATVCELNAKRSDASVATSVRSPLLDGNDGRGLGLGMFTFTYANAQTNVNLLLQIATNNVDISTLSTSVGERYWTTVTNYSFKGLSAQELASGMRSYYFGLHAVKGVMRLVMDPEVVNAVSNTVDPDCFGSIEITSALCRDEPALNDFSWWGWNVRTTDETQMLDLGDESGSGLAGALNNSVSKDIRLVDEAQYPEHLPFVQTPTFGSEVVGEVSFRARKYAPDDPTTRVTLYGAKTGLLEEDDKWVRLKSWDVDNEVFASHNLAGEPYTYKTAPGDNYCAFRFAVTGVKGVRHPMRDPDPPDPAQRILLDELFVMEAVRSQVLFRNVAAFRDQLDNMWPITNIMDRAEQPLCGESWSVQAEVYAAQLADEVDFSTAKVRLWWYEDTFPWGFENWRDRADAKRAWLAPCAGTNLVFRGGYFGAPNAVMPAQTNPKTVQYMLEVVYKTVAGAPVTNWLTNADWEKPAWYNPIDYNADYGAADGSFSGYTILDTVAPGWAWINEVNTFGEYDASWNNSDKALQFLEVAAPNDADLTGWRVRFVDAQTANDRIITNEVAVFGSDHLPGRKKDLKGMDPVSKCVFHVIGSPFAKGVLDEADGRYDGTWTIANRNNAVEMSGEVNPYYPLSIQLVRPSGIIEHEVTTMGTNYYYDTYTYQAQVHADYLNAHERGGRFFVAGDDCEGTAPGNVWSRSLGVFASNGESPLLWNAHRTMTPGRINEGQYITPDYPRPNGSAIIVYAYIDDASKGLLEQSVGGGAFTNELVTMVYRKGAEEGTNIVYRSAKWYELGQVKVNGGAVPATQTGDHLFTVEIGKNVSNDLTVVASARVSAELQTKYGLTPENRYTRAIMDWLSRGQTKRGAFAHPDSEKIGLAEYRSMRDTVVTNMTLTSMYWLDIDPTWDDGDIIYRAGFTMSPRVIPPTEVDMGGGITNIRLGVTMMITNSAAGGAAWAPYILQGDEPGVTSWDFADPSAQWAWSNATFKVTGMLINSTDYTRLSDRKSWLPLRWFVFGGGKAGDTVYSTSFDENFQSEIDIADPYSISSPGYTAGWWKYRGIYPVWNAWDIDDRIRPRAIEVLRPTNVLSH